MAKKIIFKLKSFPVASETFIVRNIVEAINNKFDVTILTENKKPIENSSQIEILEDFKLMNKTFAFAQPTRKVNRYFKAMQHFFNPILGYYFLRHISIHGVKSLSFLFWLHFFLPYRNTDTIHVHFATAINPLFELKEIGFLKSKIIVTFHGYDGHFLPESDELNKLKANFEKHVSEITVNTLFLKNKLISKGLTTVKISVIPYGIDVKYFNNSSAFKKQKKRINLISVGRLVAFKGHKLGIEVVKILVEKGYNIKYNILGEGPEGAHLEKLIAKYNLQESVNLLGKKNQEQIKEYLNKSDIFLMTSTEDSTGRREDFGVVSLEAQAMELPVVGFKSGGFPETLIDGETGFLVEDQEIEAMAAAVEKLINDRELLHKMGKRARIHVLENFSFEKTTQKYLELY